MGESHYRLYFAIKDTGIGIPKDKTSRLFQSFTQVDASTTRKYGGSGLGLTISKRLVEMMGGDIWADSAVGEGSTFHFSIQTTAIQDEEDTKDALLTDLHNKKLLIVDDNDTNRFILERQALSWEMNTKSAANGLDALAILQEDEPVDIILLDMQMPEMSGLSLAEKIIEIPSCKHVPMVMLTSLGQSLNDPRQTLLAAHLTKPVKHSELYKILAEILSKQYRLDQSAAHTYTAVSTQFDPHMAQKHPLRLLLAEDNLINQKVALRILERLGYRADIAGNGLEVLEALRRQPYDAILMDVQMPEMDGIKATEIIHQEWPPDQRPRIIAMTAHALKDDRQLLLAAGMDDYVSKPIRIETLIKALYHCPVRHYQTWDI